MRMSIVALLFCVSLAAPAEAASWEGAGWYVVVQNAFGTALQRGPFNDAVGCRAESPADVDGTDDYHCEYFDRRPDWAD